MEVGAGEGIHGQKIEDRMSALLLFWAAISCCGSEISKVDPGDYPAADHKEWGQLRWVMKIAGQP